MNQTEAPDRSTGVVSTACREGNLRNWGKPGTGEGDFNATVRVAASLGLGEGHVATGKETLLSNDAEFANLELTADGSTPLFTISAPNGPFFFRASISGGGMTHTAAAAVTGNLTSPFGETAAAIISGDGSVVYQVTNDSRLVRYDVAAATFTELVPSTPRVTAAYTMTSGPVTSVALNNVVILAGYGAFPEADFCGHPATLLPAAGIASPPTVTVRFQVPADTPIGECQVIVRGNSQFEDAIRLQIVDHDPISARLHIRILPGSRSSVRHYRVRRW